MDTFLTIKKLFMILKVQSNICLKKKRVENLQLKVIIDYITGSTYKEEI